MTSALVPISMFLPRVPALASLHDGLQPVNHSFFQVVFNQCFITTTKTKLGQQGTNWIYSFRASWLGRGGYHNFMTQFPLSHQTLNEVLGKSQHS